MAALVTFSGVDGAGKSTQAHLLAKHLTTLERDVSLSHAYSWGLRRYTWVPTRTSRSQAGPPRTRSGPETGSLSGRVGGSVLSLAILFEGFLRHRHFAGSVPDHGVEVLDRCFLDDIALALSLNSAWSAHIKAILRRLPAPAMSILLRVDPAQAALRECGDTHRVGDLALRQSLLLSVGEVAASVGWNVLITDSGLPIDRVQNNIRAALEQIELCRNC